MDFETLNYQIEQLIDAVGPSVVLESVAQVCFEKANHVAATHDDRSLAIHWSNAANRVRALRTDCKSNRSIRYLGSLWLYRKSERAPEKVRNSLAACQIK